MNYALIHVADLDLKGKEGLEVANLYESLQAASKAEEEEELMIIEKPRKKNESQSDEKVKKESVPAWVEVVDLAEEKEQSFCQVRAFRGAV